MAKPGPPGIWQEKGPWKLYVEVISGRDLPENKNPFVRLSVGNQEKLTKKVGSSIAPSWYQEYEFALSNSTQQLVCQVQDPKKFGSAAIVGEKSFPLGELIDGIERDEWLSLNRGGKIHLKILASGPLAEQNRQTAGAPKPSLGLGDEKKRVKHKYEEKKFKEAKNCKICQTSLKKMFGKSYECSVCQQAICQACFQSSDLKTHYGCKVAATAAAPMDSKMSQNVMDFYLNYTSRDRDGKLIVHSLPQEWKDLFRSAGVKPRELQSPDTVIMLLKAMDEHNAATGGGGGGVAAPPPAASTAASPTARTETGPAGEPVICKAKALYDYVAEQDGDLNVKTGDTLLIHEKLDNGWWNGTIKGVTGFFPGSYVEELPPEPVAASPPPPPPERDCDTAQGGGPPPPPGGGPPPPPGGGPPPPPGGGPPPPPGGGPPPPPGGGPPPPPSGGGPPPPPSGGGPPPPPGGPPPSGGGLGGALGAVKLKSTPQNAPAPPPSSGGGGGRSDLLAAIQAGGKLKHTEPVQKPPPAAAPTSGGGALLGVLSATIEARRKELAAAGEQQDEDDGDWDDWD